jgi:nitrate/nitrite transport system permease protein
MTIANELQQTGTGPVDVVDVGAPDAAPAPAALHEASWHPRRRRLPLMGKPLDSAITGSATRAGLGALSLVGAALVLAALWQAAVMVVGDGLPGPRATSATLWGMVSDPFYDRGPNDKGIGLQLFASLRRVFMGFALGSALAIPLGVLLGTSRVARSVIDPIVQVLRPVSPLAWFPLGLVALNSAPNAAVFVVFITSLWPTVVNTAFGVGTVPQSHRDVARVFEFSPARYLTKVVLPHSLPHILVGLRLSMGVAWLVIVAAEMLSGGTGIGFFVWDSWNALNLEQVISAILLIGIVGLILDRGFAMIARRYAYAEVP